MKPLSQDQVVATFGDPTPFLHADGTIDRAWEKRLTYVQLPAPLPLSWNPSVTVSRFLAHNLVAPIFQQAFENIYNVPEAWHSINDFGGCYAFRPVRGKSSLSRHSWGIAIDIDVRDNPFLGMVPRVNPFVREIFRRHGFAWGGATVWGGDFPWSRRDAMHFELADLERLK